MHAITLDCVVECDMAELLRFARSRSQARNEIWGNGVMQDAKVVSHIAYLSENIARGQKRSCGWYRRTAPGVGPAGTLGAKRASAVSRRSSLQKGSSPPRHSGTDLPA